MKKLISIILSGAMCATLAFGLAACGTSNDSGDSSSTGDSSVAVSVSSVKISGNKSVYVGGSLTLTASVTMSDGSAYGGSITWASSDESVATVAGGVVTGVAKGTTKITAAADGVTSSTFTVTVSERPSDVVDADGWVSALTSADIYNSTAVGNTILYSDDETEAYMDIAVSVDLTEADGVVTGAIYSLTSGYSESYTDYNESAYYLIEENAVKYYNYLESENSENCELSSETYSEVLDDLYGYLRYADGSYFGGDYFNYSETAGAYVWENSLMTIAIKIIDSNVTYMKTSVNLGGVSMENVLNYSYGGVSVTIPENVQSKFDELSETGGDDAQGDDAQGDDAQDDDAQDGEVVITSDIVDVDGWVAAMTTSDILNSTLTGSVSIKIMENESKEITDDIFNNLNICVDLTETESAVTGNISASLTGTDNGSDMEIYEYYQYDETGAKVYSSDGDVCETITTLYDTLLFDYYMQYDFIDGGYFGYEYYSGWENCGYGYFEYNEEEGAYIFEYSLDAIEHIIVTVKIVDGNLVYFSESIESVGDNATIIEFIELYYSYGGVSVTIPDEIQSLFDNLN